MKRGRVVADFLTFSRTEQRGIMVLCLLLLGLIITNMVIPAETFQQPVSYAALETRVHDFEMEWVKAQRDDSLERIKNRFLRRKGQDTAHAFHLTKIPTVIVELNGADTFALQQLRGIGPAFARRIVNYRARLGGYIGKQQVLEVFGMDSARYLQIEKSLIVNPDSVVKIDMNKVTFKQLLRHPYFSFEVTKNIILWRQKNKRFTSEDDLRKVSGVNDSIYHKVKPYIRIGH